jgi:hypothetical protein
MTLASQLWVGGFVGIAFGLVNFWLLARIVRGMVQAEKVKKWKTLVYFLIKIGFLILIIGLLLEKAYVSPLPFLGGFTVSLIASVCAVVFKSNFRSSAESREP